MVTLAGDFLGPSLLSSLDHGKGMIDCLNKVPVSAVCFGNHESDVPYPSLVRRIDEFKGVWLNSNMPTFEPKCPEHHLFEFAGGRSVAMIGLNVGRAAPPPKVFFFFFFPVTSNLRTRHMSCSRRFR